MVAIPIGYDQPGVAARIAHHRVGEFLEIEDLTVERLRHLIQRVLNDPRYRDKARWFQKVIAQTRGLDVAADAIEQAFGVTSLLQFGDAWPNISKQANTTPLNGSNGAESATESTQEHFPDISE